MKLVDPLNVLVQMIIMLIIIFGGYVVQKAGKVQNDNKKFLSFLVVNIFNPALLISSVITNHEPRDYNSVWITFGIASAMFALFILIAKIASYATKSESDKITIKLMFVFSNLGFIGLPVIKNVLGDSYVIYNAIYNLVYNVVFYTYGISLTSEEKGFKFSNLKGLLSMGTLGAVVAISLFFLNVQVPEIAEKSVVLFGQSCVPMALFIIGITVGEQESLLNIIKSVKNWIFLAVKMLAIPLLCAVILKHFPYIPEDHKQLALLMIGMPVGSLPLLLLAERNMDTTFCSNGIIITTIFSVLTLPGIVWLYQYL